MVAVYILMVLVLSAKAGEEANGSLKLNKLIRNFNYSYEAP